jgi:hypothetical protein
MRTHVARQNLLAAVVLGSVSPIVHGQVDACDPMKGTLAGCFQQSYDAAKGNAPPPAETLQEQDEQSAKKELAKAQTGADSAGATTASTLTDLVPLFDALGMLGNSGDQADGTLALNLNFLLPVQDADKNTQLSLIVNTAPEPFDQLVQAFPESARAARKETLQRDISTFGDSRAELTWSLVNRRFGRDFGAARKILAPIYEGARNKVVAATGQRDSDAAVRLTQLTSRLTRHPDAGATDARTEFGKYPDKIAASRFELIAQAKEAGEAAGSGAKATSDELTRAGLANLASLVNQQPQLLFTLSHDIRDSIAGPEKTSAKLTWEFTSRNLSNFLSDTGSACRDKDQVRQGGAVYTQCVTALSRYVSRYADALEKQPRWKLSAAYQRVAAAQYSFPSDNVTLDLPRTERIEVALGWGRPLSAAKNADRIDLEASYDSNVDNDTSNKERLKATLTYTRRVAEMDMPFSIVYANKDEYLGEVDHRISLHIGIKFKPPAATTK